MLMGKSLKWATMVWEKDRKPMSSYEHFFGLFHRVFNPSHKRVEVGDTMLTINQGNSLINIQNI